MFENLDLFRMSSAMAAHAGQKQAIVTQNVANADTPGYVAREVPDFRAIYSPTQQGPGQWATRQSHLNGTIVGQSATQVRTEGGDAAPNGNQVSLEVEMLNSVAAKRQHDRALAIYKSALNILRASIRT